jgi:nitrogen fixation protein FixH
MKINWGTGIVIAIALFMSFILYFVITMMTDSKYEYDMVVEDYYKKEIGFQDELDARNNAARLAYKVQLTQDEQGVELYFPEEISSKMKEAQVFFYRVNQKDLDFELPVQLEDNGMFIPAAMLEKGRWDVTIRWEMDGKNYITIENISF